MWRCGRAFRAAKSLAVSGQATAPAHNRSSSARAEGARACQGRGRGVHRGAAGEDGGQRPQGAQRGGVPRPARGAACRDGGTARGARRAKDTRGAPGERARAAARAGQVRPMRARLVVSSARPGGATCRPGAAGVVCGDRPSPRGAGGATRRARAAARCWDSARGKELASKTFVARGAAACRDQWKKTMHKRIQDTKQFMMKLTDNQLEMTTKRTIMENEQMGAEMAYQSRQSTALLGQNRVLDARLVELKQALALSRETEDELAKRNTIYQSTIKQLVCPPHRPPRYSMRIAVTQGSAPTITMYVLCSWSGCSTRTRRRPPPARRRRAPRRVRRSSASRCSSRAYSSTARRRRSTRCGRSSWRRARRRQTRGAASTASAGSSCNAWTT